MSASPRPCAHCGNGTFHIIPNMCLDFATPTTVLGMNAVKAVKGRYWAVSLVVCTQCGGTQFFTANAQQLAQWVPGSSQAAVPR